MSSRTVLSATCLLALAWASTLPAAPKGVSFSRPAGSIEAYDFVEITARIESPDAPNPFTDATLRGSFGKAGESVRTDVDGFCDAADGSLFRIRFMPSAPGNYTLLGCLSSGRFRGQGRRASSKPWTAIGAAPSGSIPIIPGISSGKARGEHYFFNGTTAYWLPGFREERIITYSIERLHQLKVNRLRVLLAGRDQRRLLLR